MLSPALVRVRREKGRLSIVSLEGRRRERARELAGGLLEVLTACRGARRGELIRAWDALEASPNERKLVLGLRKVLEDACEFDSAATLDPAELRRETFELAARLRVGTPRGETFDRDAVLREIGAKHGLEPNELVDQLYSDLPNEQRVVKVGRASVDQILESYELAALQGVLLRASRVVAVVRARRPEVYRELFQALKFRRLLYRLRRTPDDGYEIDLDGPFSLFESVTKYGLNFSLILPKLLACDELDLRAELRWGKRRDRLEFLLSRRGTPDSGAAQTFELRDDVRALIDDFRALGSAWQVEPTSEILDVPGVGLCIPDLKFSRGAKSDAVFLELLGFWSRDAVFQRIELAERGLSQKILFAVSERLRVSEELLDENDVASLVVYKGRINARTLLRKLEQPSRRSGSRARGNA
jgi:uncharacterized protein